MKTFDRSGINGGCSILGIHGDYFAGELIVFLRRGLGGSRTCQRKGENSNNEERFHRRLISSVTLEASVR